MKIYIIAKPKSKKEYVKKIDDTHYIVAVKEPPLRGIANLAIVNILSNYFHKPPSQIFIISGEKSRQKVIEVPITFGEIKNLDVQKKLF